MDTLQKMRIFVRVVECGSFTAAAHALDTSTSVVSRAIMELETHLRSRLLNRTTRRVSVTTAGDRYLQRCKSILAEVSLAEEELSNSRDAPSGTLRVHSFAGIGQFYILPAVKMYRAMYPDVALKVTLSQNVPDLYDGNTDISIVSTGQPLPDSDLIATFLGRTSSVLCASPEYLASAAVLTKPAELGNHECIFLDSPLTSACDWVLDSPQGTERVRINGNVSINMATSIEAAIRAGMGVGPLPVYIALAGLRDGSLIRVLPEFTLQETTVYALHPSARYTAATIKTWIEFLKDYVPRLTARDSSVLKLNRFEYISPELVPARPESQGR
jgi:DNA-binding transcriptional LysR family regulator